MEMFYFEAYRRIK